MELRPLGFGEIFDRAVTLYIRNFIPFAAIVMVLVLPLAILQYYLDRAAQPQFDAILKDTDQSRSRGAVKYSQYVRIAGHNRPNGRHGAFGVFDLAVLAQRRGRRRRAALPQPARRLPRVLSVVLQRWSQILALMFVELLVLVGWYVAAILVIVAVFFVVVALSAASAAFAFWFGFIGFVIVFVAMVPILAPLFVALTFAMYATVIEESPVIASLLQGFARVFNRGEFWRALLFAIATGAVVAGASTAFSVLGMLAAFAHLPSVEAIIESLSRAVIGPFGVVLLAIYYFDVRIRREGFDLESSLERLAGAQPS